MSVPLSAQPSSPEPRYRWVSPLEARCYLRDARLSIAEERALGALLGSRSRWGEGSREAVKRTQAALGRLLEPLRDALALIPGKAPIQDATAAYLLRGCARHRLSYWGWSAEQWSRVLGGSRRGFLEEHGGAVQAELRHQMMAVAYHLGCFRDVSRFGHFKRETLALRVFGEAAVKAAAEPVCRLLLQWGYSKSQRRVATSTLCGILLELETAHLEGIKEADLERFRRGKGASSRSSVLQISKALAHLGVLERPLEIAPYGERAEGAGKQRKRYEGVSSEWLSWVLRWEQTSTLAPKTRASTRNTLCKVGRWLAQLYPHNQHPDQWDRDLAARYVAAVDRMRVLDYAGPRVRSVRRRGEPLSARSKDRYLGEMRLFFRDCQEWGWIPRRFDPGRVFATPRSVKALIGPAPRTIGPDTWAKLLWAGLNLTREDLRATQTGPYYPVEFVRAVAIVWLFAGLRSNEIVRLRVGCMRWPEGSPTADPDCSPESRICYLDIPVSKTATAFSKPVDRLVGEAIEAWEQLRPSQPSALDAKTGEAVELLFCYRARPLPREYINGSLIPLLCRKGGVPTADTRGNFTSHRARATIASQLFNARKPLRLSELQAWLGHRSPQSTQSYVGLTPTRLAGAYADAGYFARNMRAIEVLIDQDAVRNLSAAEGAVWRYYDLGHGLCAYEFFEQCPHRVACARCDFYSPKESAQAQLLEAKGNLLRLLQEFPLTEEERAAVDGDLLALGRLVARLAEERTPSGKTPKELTP